MFESHTAVAWLLSTVACSSLLVVAGCQQQATAPKPTAASPPAKVSPQAPASDEAESQPASKAAEPVRIPFSKSDLTAAGMRQLDPEGRVWLDRKGRRVIVEGYVCLRNGPLEMLVTTAGSKEHESVVAVKSSAFVIHAALVALGSQPGEPVRFRPEYAPARGPQIEVSVQWQDEHNETKSVRGQDWVRHAGTQKALNEPFIFAGSRLERDDSGQERYLAEDGDLICVSNFPTAMLDLPIVSPQSGDLQFEAYTERIPPQRTPVHVILALR